MHYIQQWMQLIEKNAELRWVSQKHDTPDDWHTVTQ